MNDVHDFIRSTPTPSTCARRAANITLIFAVVAFLIGAAAGIVGTLYAVGKMKPPAPRVHLHEPAQTFTF